MTEAPAIKLARALAGEGAELTVHDPKIRGGENALLLMTCGVATDVLTATEGTQAAVLMTEWSEIAEADWATVAAIWSRRVIFDGRNALAPVTMRRQDSSTSGSGGPQCRRNRWADEGMDAC